MLTLFFIVDAETLIVPSIVGGGADRRGCAGAGLAGRLHAHIGRQPQLDQRVLQSFQQVRSITRSQGTWFCYPSEDPEHNDI